MTLPRRAPKKARRYWACHYSGGAGPLPLPKPVIPAAMPFFPLTLLDRLWEPRAAFTYVERGKMASMGMWGGVMDVKDSGISPVRGGAEFLDGRRDRVTRPRAFLDGRRGRELSPRRGRSNTGPRHAGRRRRVPVLAHGLLQQAGLDPEHDPHPHVLVQELGLRTGYLAVLTA